MREVADGVWVRQSEFCRMNSVLVVSGTDCLLIDPGVTGAELADLARFVAERGLRVVAGVSTHPHWDHLLWHGDFGAAPRWATARAVAAAAGSRPTDVAEARRLAPGADPGLLGLVSALPEDAEFLPWTGPRIRLIRHDAHAPGHLGLLIESAAVLIAGDMLSDVEIPLLDTDSLDPVGDYRSGLDLLAGVDPRLVIPGHGSMGDRNEFRRRLVRDRRYLDALISGGGEDDPRLSAGTTDWLVQTHAAQRDLLRRQAENS